MYYNKHHPRPQKTNPKSPYNLSHYNTQKTKKKTSLNLHHPSAPSTFQSTQRLITTHLPSNELRAYSGTKHAEHVYAINPSYPISIIHSSFHELHTHPRARKLPIYTAIHTLRSSVFSKNIHRAAKNNQSAAPKIPSLIARCCTHSRCASKHINNRPCARDVRDEQKVAEPV